MLLRANCLCSGYSGVNPDIVNLLLTFLNYDITPVVPEKGSVGASGDLCPLAHLFIPLIGLGELTIDNGISYVPTQTILSNFNLKKIELGAKEGLALINGTQFMAAHGIKIVERLLNCQNHADLIAALSLEGYMGSQSPFDVRLHQVRPHPGAQIVAERMRTFLHNSEILSAHEDCARVQDPYSFRCIPQIHGASRDALVHLTEIITREINSVTDNPNIFLDGKEPIAISGGGFHGEPIALPMDYAGLAASELGNISDRRIYLLMGEKGEYGLPLYLIKGSGLNSGFMITQYCSAALVSENKSLCYPASADSIPTSNGVEDLVSMGSISARKTLRIIDNLEKILGVELFCACQAVDFRRPLKSSPILEECYQYVRTQIPHIEDDEILSVHMKAATKIIQSKKLLSFFDN